MIEDPPALMTSGYDRLVKLWNYDQSTKNDDRCVGILRRQNHSKQNKISKEWTFRVDVDKYVRKKNAEALQIVENINVVVELETQRRAAGDQECNPFYDHKDDHHEQVLALVNERVVVDRSGGRDGSTSGSESAAASHLQPLTSGQKMTMDNSERGGDEGGSGGDGGREEVVGGMTQDEIDQMYDSVRTKVSNLSETRDRLINDFSNLTRAERSKRQGMSLASNLRRTPRLHPVGPQDAGRGLSATPAGRSSRMKSKRK